MGAKPRVLTIEDEPGVRHFIRAALEESFEMVEAADGPEGFSQARWKQPDLILLDLHLPGMDGLTVLAQLKGNVHTSHIPVVVVSARGETQVLLASQRGGAVDHLIKPFDIAELRKVIQQHLPIRE